MADGIRFGTEPPGRQSTDARAVLKHWTLQEAFPWLAFAAIAMIGLAMQFRGITGAFLGDDFSHLDLISRIDGQSRLWSWTLARFHEPLGNGTFAYRPLAFASFALDWAAYHDDAAGWRITSLILFSVNAILAGAIVARWLKGQSSHAMLGGVVAGSAMFTYPFAGEISYWLAGRFDLLACLFTLLFLRALPLGRRSSPGQHLWRIAFLVCALLSKESAIPLPFDRNTACVRLRGRWLRGWTIRFPSRRETGGGRNVAGLDDLGRVPVMENLAVRFTDEGVSLSVVGDGLR